MNPITETTWRRLPWHAKARIVAKLDAEARAVRTELEALQSERNELAAKVDHLREEARTRLTYLHGLPASPVKVIWPTDDQWTDEELRAAHRDYVRGDRDEWTVAGHRIWDKQRARRRYERHRAANRERMRAYRARLRAEREQAAS